MDIKYSILKLFKDSRGEWLSAEDLRKRYTISRTVLWKNINSLRDEGYTIEASPRRGYKLTGIPDLMLPFEIRDGLETNMLGRGKIIHYRETDSTNSKAKELAESGYPEGTIVIAENQLIGRGRMNRKWFSPPGAGIYMSVILRPVLSPTDSPMITIMTAAALADALATIDLSVQIKWPNDILLNGKKLSGILSEMDTERDLINYIILGVGINVNTPHTILPDDIKNTATSIMIETGRSFDRVNILKTFLKYLEQYYEYLKREDFYNILAKWKECSNVIGRKIRVDLPNEFYTGKAVDISRNGALLLEDTNGTIVSIVSGDVSLL